MKVSKISFVRPSLSANQSSFKNKNLSKLSYDTVQFSAQRNNNAHGQLKILSVLLSSDHFSAQSILNFEQSIQNLSQKEKEDFICW